MQIQTASRLVALAICLLAASTDRARADFTYNIAGTFGSDIIGTTGLAGGSFSGTYTIPSSYTDPQTSQGFRFTGYQVNLFNAAGGLVYTFNYSPHSAGLPNPPNGGYFAQNIDPTHSIIGFFDDPMGTGSTDQSILQLEFNAPFFGSGSAVGYGPQEPIQSVFVMRTGATVVKVGITSAVSSVPAPPSLVLVGISGLLGLGRLGMARSGRPGSVT